VLTKERDEEEEEEEMGCWVCVFTERILVSCAQLMMKNVMRSSVDDFLLTDG